MASAITEIFKKYTNAEMARATGVTSMTTARWRMAESIPTKHIASLGYTIVPLSDFIAYTEWKQRNSV